MPLRRLPSFIQRIGGPRLAVGLAAARHAVHLLLGLLLEEARAVLGRLAIEALLVARRRPRATTGAPTRLAGVRLRFFAAGSRATLFDLSTDVSMASSGLRDKPARASRRPLELAPATSREAPPRSVI